jgi:branched-chain amino acid transport system substrate-binding protein
LNKAGWKEADFEPYDPANHDYSALITHLKSLGVETVFIGGFPVEEGSIVRQMRNVGLKAQTIAGDLSSDTFWSVAGTSGEGTLFVFPSDPRKEPKAKEAIDRMQKDGSPVIGYTLYHYAATQTLAQALAKAGGAEPKKVAETMHHESFDTILGSWSFDAKGDVRNIHQVMYRWHDGQYAEIKE